MIANQTLRLLVIGIGPHARTFYLPALLEMEETHRVKVVGLVDLEPQRELIDAWCSACGLNWPRHYLAPFSENLTSEAEYELGLIMAETPFGGVIISTDPLSHKCYALWAMRVGLHILLDKPVSTSRDAVTDLAAAKAIERDYEELAEARATHHESRAFILCAHRRFHPGFDAALDLVKEASARTGCPVTNQHAYHSDGQWRLPEEILRQDHHSYHHGHGKLSHSGFHFLDAIYRFRKAGSVSGKEPDEVEITAAFLQPDGFMDQLNRGDYQRLFGSGFDATAPTPDDELMQHFGRFGEMDVEATLAFRRCDRTVALASVSLLHGGFSRRSWLLPGDDLYKGNGRVKHEQHRVHVGPFLGLQIHSYQAKDRHRNSGPGDEEVGGNNHFEILVFRNNGILGGEAFERITFRDLPAATGFRSDQLFIEQVKRGAILEFIGRATGCLAPNETRSDFSDHHLPVRLMSALYCSHIQKNRSGNPQVIIPWNGA